MDGLALVLVIVLLLAVAALIVGLVQRKRANQPRGSTETTPQDPFATNDSDALYGDPRALRAGDIVEMHGAPYTVRGSLHFDEGGWTWAEHLLDDAKDTQVWLSVEEDPDLELSVWTPDPDIETEPGSSRVELNGRSYKRDESGRARYRTEATTGLDEDGSVRYYDYEASDGAMLSFESFGDAEWEASTGEFINQHAIRIYPMSRSD